MNESIATMTPMTDRIDEFGALQRLRADVLRLMGEIDDRFAILAGLGERLDLAEACWVARCDADRAAFALPDEEDLRLALFDAGGLDRPVTVSAIARVLWHGEHGHGDLIRLGRRLGMLASVGLVVRHGASAPYRWSLR